MTFQRMGIGGKGRTENRWDVSGAGQSASPEVYLVFSWEVHKEELVADSTTRTRDPYLLTLQSAVL